MKLLAFDTATEQMSVAVDIEGVVHSVDAAGGALASAMLLPTIMDVLGRAGATLRDLDAIAFGRGPGAFTGLRTACSVAQGLAYGAGKPVLPIDSLLAVAEAARRGPGEWRVWSLIDARMNEIYAAQYRYAGIGHGLQGWQVLDAPMLVSAAALNERWRAEPPLAVAGNALSVFDAVLDTQGAERLAAATPTARALLRLAGAAWARGDAVDPALALPLYLRDKVALTTVERDAARAAKDAQRAVAVAVAGGAMS